MAEVVSDIIISPAKVYYAPTGTAVPADSVAADTAWGGAWVYVGFTKTPLSMKYEYEKFEIEVEQSFAPVDRIKKSETLTLETVLAELNLTNLNLVVDGTVTATAAGAGQVGKEELDAGGVSTLTKRAWGFEGKYVDEDGATFPIRLFIWKGTASMNGDLEFGKDDYAGISLQIEALADRTKSLGQQLFKMQKVLEPAT